MRKLASIQAIKCVKPIPDADSIETVGVLGWEVVSKKGEFKENDKCVYFEIDSLLPERPEFEFLRKSCYKEDLKKFRLRTVRLRKKISQGLALPLSIFPELANLDVGVDVTEILGVEKYEPPIPAQISGDAKSFIWPISKTDEIRIQTEEGLSLAESLKNKPYYISLKLDGTSSTYIIKENEFHVCGRNYSYKKSSDHSFWKIEEKYNIENGLRKLGNRIAIQGECVGPGIQKNPLGLNFVDFFVFNVVEINNNVRLPLDESRKIVETLGLNFVPIIEFGENFSYSKDELLDKAKGKYIEHFNNAKKDQEREGIVIRSNCSNISFKVINNNFLLKED
jgi:RNA ligase (TIGR02306 family)